MISSVTSTMGESKRGFDKRERVDEEKLVKIKIRRLDESF